MLLQLGNRLRFRSRASRAQLGIRLRVKKRSLHFQLDPQQPGIDHWVVIGVLRPFLLPYYFSISCLWCFPLWLSIYRRFVYAFNQSFVGVRWSMGVASSPCHIRQDAAGVKVAL